MSQGLGSPREGGSPASGERQAPELDSYSFSQGGSVLSGFWVHSFRIGFG